MADRKITKEKGTAAAKTGKAVGAKKSSADKKGSGRAGAGERASKGKGAASAKTAKKTAAEKDFLREEVRFGWEMVKYLGFRIDGNFWVSFPVPFIFWGGIFYFESQKPCRKAQINLCGGVFYLPCRAGRTFVHLRCRAETGTVFYGIGGGKKRGRYPWRDTGIFACPPL